ncbi:MAG: hypothetical protein MOB07_06645 [Acidobacteria bacterium]|nr:hypothetical protein [Acidobacteriota bacterium]
MKAKEPASLPAEKESAGQPVQVIATKTADQIQNEGLQLRQHLNSIQAQRVVAQRRSESSGDPSVIRAALAEVTALDEQQRVLEIQIKHLREAYFVAFREEEAARIRELDGHIEEAQRELDKIGLEMFPLIQRREKVNQELFWLNSQLGPAKDRLFELDERIYRESQNTARAA